MEPLLYFINILHHVEDLGFDWTIKIKLILKYTKWKHVVWIQTPDRKWCWPLVKFAINMWAHSKFRNFVLTESN
jgi:hypothetical protein